MPLIDRNGVEVHVGDWLTNGLTGGLFEALEVSDLAARLAKIDEVWDPDLTRWEDVKAEEIRCHYYVNPADETIDDVLMDFLTQDYNKKFYRIAYVAFARRVMRSWDASSAELSDEFERTVEAIYEQISAIRTDIESGAFVPQFEIGSVLDVGEAAVTLTGTYMKPVLNFVIPKGDTGETGPKGDTGETGPVGPMGPSGNGVVTELASGMFMMTVEDDGHLYLTQNEDDPPIPLKIKDGRLVYVISE